MSPKILRRCDICGKYQVSCVMEDVQLGKLYLCYPCWKVRVAFGRVSAGADVAANNDNMEHEIS